MQNQDKCKLIILNSTNYIKQFMNKDKELQIARDVIDWFVKVYSGTH